MKIVIWRSRTSRKLHGTMVSTSRKGRGTIWVSIVRREEKRQQTRCDVNRARHEMKAVDVHKYGGREVLKFEHYPDPAPGAGEVLARVAAASACPLDCKH